MGPSSGSSYRLVGLLASIGVSFAVASAGGFVLGSWLDKKLETRPILTLVLGLLGVAAAFLNLFRTLAKAERLEHEQEHDDENHNPGSR